MLKTRIITINTGHQVGISIYGDPKGWPVIALHGAPASRLTFATLDEAALDSGVRLISVDRPGIGRSSPKSLSTIASYVSDLDAVAQVLDLERFAIIGWSAGGPYALAMGALRPERVLSIGLMASVAPTSWIGGLDGLTSLDRNILEWSTRIPLAAQLTLGALGLMARWMPKAALGSFEEDLCPADLDQLRRQSNPKESMAFFVEAFHQGPGAVVEDYRRWSEPWGFDLNDIEVPVEIWHGAEDRMVPIAAGEYFAERLPRATLHRLPEDGHISLSRHGEAIFESLRKHDRAR